MQENQDFFSPVFVLPKRKRGRPKGSTKSMSSVSPGVVGRPRKDKDTSKVKTTILFHLTKSTESQIVVHRGGSRSSKSYSIAQLIVEYFFTLPKIKILILRKTSPSLRTSVVPLIYEIIDTYGLRNRITEVKMDRNIWSPVKGLIHFSGLDDPEKIKCFHPDTELFTDTGFKKITEIKIGDLVATMDPRTRKAKFLPLEDMSVGNFSGEMISPGSTNQDRDPWTNFCVTPDHEMLVNSRRKTRKNGTVNLEFKEAKTFPLNNGNYAVPQSCIWTDGEIIDNWEIPRIDWNVLQDGKNNKNGKKATVFPIVSWMKFLGWYLSEGCLSGDCTAVICQKKEVGRQQIVEDLKDFPIKVVPTKEGFNLYSKDLVAYLRQFGDCYAKFIPREILNLHPSLLRHLFDSLMAGDGIKFRDGRWAYGSASKQLAEDVFEIAIKLGFTASIRNHDTAKSYGPGGHLCYSVNVTDRRYSPVPRALRVPYEGLVYCPTVSPYNTVLSRYNGKLAWTGQSSDWNICWLEEANEFSYTDFNNLKVRLSSPIPMNAPWFRNKLILSLNPVNQFCWVKTRAIDNKSEDLKEIVSSYKFNPFLSDDYRNLIEALRFQDENHYRIFAQGEWGVLENIIYSKWETVPELSEGEEVFGLDFGVTNETALVRCFIDGLEMGIESWIYETGMTNSDLIARMERMFSQEQKERCPIYCDTAEKNRLIELENAGFYVVPANKSVLEGLDYVSRLNIKIKDDSEPIIKEIRAYSRKEDKRTGRVGEFPIKWADHCMDAMRYAAFTHYTETTQNTPSLRVLDFFDSHARDTWENDEDY